MLNRTPTESRLDLLKEMEKSLGTTIEAKLLPLFDTQRLANSRNDEIIRSIKTDCETSIKKFLSQDDIGKSFISNDVSNTLTEYLNAKIWLFQAVNCERDILTLSNFLRKTLGIEKAIAILENIQRSDFDVKQVEKDLGRLLPSSPSYNEMVAIINYINMLYLVAQNKQELTTSLHLSQNEKSYQQILESLMWINSQLQFCIYGMNTILNQNTKNIAKSLDNNVENVNKVYGARTNIQASIGVVLDDELSKLMDKNCLQPADDIMKIIKGMDFYQQFIHALSSATRAGFKTYLPEENEYYLHCLIDDFISTSIYIFQCIACERNVVTISQHIRSHYGIRISQELLTNIIKPGFDDQMFYQRYGILPNHDIQKLIQSVHQFYQCATIKKNNGLFDDADESSQRLFESVMWVDLQRQRCIKGMKLIESKEVYEGKQITVADFSPLDEALLGKRKHEDKNDSPSNVNNKKQSSQSDASTYPSNGKEEEDFAMEQGKVKFSQTEQDLIDICKEAGISKEEAIEFQELLVLKLTTEDIANSEYREKIEAMDEATQNKFIIYMSLMESKQEAEEKLAKHQDEEAAINMAISRSLLSSTNTFFSSAQPPTQQQHVSILNEAKNAIDKLEKQAAKENMTIEAPAPDIHDINSRYLQSKYEQTHEMKIGLPMERLSLKESYAVVRLLISIIDNTKSKIEKDNKIKLLYTFTDTQFVLRASYTTPGIYQRFAPIAYLPYAVLKQALQNLINSLAVGWKATDSAIFLEKKASDDEVAFLNDIQKACKEINEKFDLQTCYISRDSNFVRLTVDKGALETAKALLQGGAVTNQISRKLM